MIGTNKASKKVIYQERLFEGYMNVAIDNFIRDRKKISLYMPSQTQEGILGYDISFGDTLFIQYKSLEEPTTGNFSISLMSSEKNPKYDPNFPKLNPKTISSYKQQNVLKNLEKLN